MGLRSADHADLLPWPGRHILRKPGEDANAPSVWQGVFEREGTTEPDFVVIRNPHGTEFLGVLLDKQPRRPFEPFRNRQLQLVGHEHPGHFGVVHAVAVVTHDVGDAVRFDGRPRPRGFVRDAFQEARHLAGDLEQRAAFRVGDVGARFVVKGDRLTSKLALEEGERRALGADVHLPATVDRMLDQRRRSRRVSHAPIEEGKQDRRPGRGSRVHPCEVQ